MQGFSGTGPGARTCDGCSVELYLRQPATGEPERIAACVAPGGSILELGCGTGRVTHPLAALGFQVTAVDNSAEMLTHVRGAATVQSDIEALQLGRTFDAVVLASNLINTPGRHTRHRLLMACRGHVASLGAVIIERRSPDNFFNWKIGAIAQEAGLRHLVEAVAYKDRLAHVTIRSQAMDAAWTQSFTTECLDDNQFGTELAGAGLWLERWLDAPRSWALAKPCHAGT